MNSSLIPAFFAGTGVTLATLVLVEFALYVAARYRERFLQETSTELDDILIQIPPNRMLDLSLGVSCSGAILSFGVLVSQLDELPWWWCLILALAFAGALFPLPRYILRLMKRRRLDKFNLQLEDALGMISSSLKAGFSINQALEEVADQNIHPIAVEFRLLTQELRLGVPFEQALENMNRRLGSDDFELVASAILTARQTGGELTGALERVAALIRERVRITNKVRALTAMGRLQAIMIGAMPFLLLAGMRYVSPVMMANFFGTAFGWVALAVVVVLDICGFLIIRKITTIEV